MGESRLRALDGLRGLAVLGVVAHHASLLPFGIGARGVDLFFVISGFCLSLPALSRMRNGLPFTFDGRRFAVGRLLRIVPPYFVALAVFVALSFTMLGVPTSRVPAMPYEWLLDGLFLTSGSPAYNASFWTLGVEARWYVFFPALLGAYVYSKPLFALLAAVFYGTYIWEPRLLDAGTMPCFMLGIVACDLYLRGKAQSIALVFAAPAAVAIAAWFDKTDSVGDPLWHVAAFLMVLAGVGAASRVVSWRPLATVGIASYSIYLVHQPVLYWFAQSSLPWLVCAALSVVVGFVFWRLVEAPLMAAAANYQRRRRVVPGAVAS